MKISVIGLGYVGLPLAVELARAYPELIGFDIDASKIEKLKNGKFKSVDVEDAKLKSARIQYTSQSSDIKGSDLFIVTVPTPIDENNQPDLTALKSASELVGSALKQGSIVVYESTVYPGVTEDVCGPILESQSGLTCGKDFKLAYSPERINPGDKVHTLSTTVKVIAAQDEETLNIIQEVYGKVVKAGLHRASSIKVAEACKVIENIQRDINIALMNELAKIFDLLNIPTSEVLAAAGTKWNFLKFTPGLVGGHCIGVDPYYLTNLAQRVGYHPEVILAGRRINDNMGRYVAQRTVKEMIKADIGPNNSDVGVLGVTFKENVDDIRNSRVFEIIRELEEFGCNVIAHDPLADPKIVKEEEGIELADLDAFSHLEAVVIAVAHDEYAKLGPSFIKDTLKNGGVVIDVKSLFKPSDFADRYRYWSL